MTNIIISYGCIGNKKIVAIINLARYNVGIKQVKKVKVQLWDFEPITPLM